jgi:hypothetical protein
MHLTNMADDRQTERRFYEHVSELAEQRAAEPRMPRSSIDWSAWKPKLRKAALVAAVALALLLAVAYAWDLVSIRYVVPLSRKFDSVNVDWFYSVQEKGGKFEFIYDHTQPESCVNSLFPHYGMAPCWYARRHRDRRIEM